MIVESIIAAMWHRSNSSHLAGTATWLVRNGYTTRRLRKNELYEYTITDAGRAALGAAT